MNTNGVKGRSIALGYGAKRFEIHFMGFSCFESNLENLVIYIAVGVHVPQNCEISLVGCQGKGSPTKSD